MKLLKTKYYPVNLDEKTIHDAPERREIDVARKCESKIVGILGSRLMAHKCYETFTVVPA